MSKKTTTYESMSKCVHWLEIFYRYFCALVFSQALLHFRVTVTRMGLYPQKFR